MLIKWLLFTSLESTSADSDVLSKPNCMKPPSFTFLALKYASF